VNTYAVGVLHVRPALDMKDAEQERVIRELTDAVAALVTRYGGVLWGEHGKGLRSEYAPEFFGPLYPRLQQIKAVFDPRNQLNPGKIASPHADGLIRLDQPPTRGQHDRVIPIAIRDDFADALHCNGNGACFNFDADDAMCPSWKGSRDRRSSPKGRASLVREWLRLIASAGGTAQLASPGQGFWRTAVDFPTRLRHTLGKRLGEYDFSHEVRQSMDNCLACKSCTGQCPIKVDIPQLRSQFLEHYHTRYVRPLKDHVVAWLEPLLPILAKIPKLANGLLRNDAVRLLIRRLDLVEIPGISRQPLESLLRGEGFEVASKDAIARLGGKRDQAVVVVQDAFTTHFEAELVLDTFRLLRSLGFVPMLAPYLPNGKPLQVLGFRRRFATVARRNAAMLNTLAASGVALVGIDPAMTLVYRAEYRKALGDMPVPPVLLLQEWLARSLPAVPASAGEGKTYHLLPHCTEKTNAPEAMAQWIDVFAAFGQRLCVLPSGCCGMAGLFGHAASNRALSEDIYRLSWAPALERHRNGGNLMATGYSCRCQTKIMDDVALPHPVQTLLGLQPVHMPPPLQAGNHP
jgi:Fe-S oxidoreductase